MSCKYNNCKICGYKSECEIYKENAELKNKLENRNCLDCSNHSSKLRMRNLELEKENAELKAFRQDCVKLTEDNVVIVRQRAETSKQLTKATELLRKLVLEVKGYEEIYGYDTCEPVQEAEQFLKEVEK